MHYTFHFEGREDDLSQVVYLIDKEFVDTYGLSIVAGKNLQVPISPQGGWEIMVSELTTREAGYVFPSEALGKSFNLEEDSGQIVGVVNDINIYSLRRIPHSITYLVTPVSNHNYVSIRFLPQDLKGVLAHIRKTWQEMIPAYPLDYFFLDESFLAMHRSEQKMGKIFSVFSILAIFVAGLGLLGLAAHTVEQKTKEIGVRKVLGASSLNVYTLLSGEFLRWVLLANLVAWPAAYYAMHTWLQGFAFRVDIGWEVFFLSGGLALLISLAIVSFQTLKAAVADPVDSLHYE